MRARAAARARAGTPVAHASGRCKVRPRPHAGTVTAVAKVDLDKPLIPLDAADGTAAVVTEIFNKNQELLCRTTAYWNIKRA